MAIEKPPFNLESKTDAYEIRNYPPTLVAETPLDGDFDQAGSQAFRILAAYIFGNNRSKTKMAMTSPVNQSKAGNNFLVQFTMPLKFDR